MKYDVIIIGAGPGGIFAAYELMKKKPDCKIAVFEEGYPLEKRKCPIDGEKVKSCINCKRCSIMCGCGGAGAFSDGKYNITNDFGGTLFEYIGKKQAVELMKYVDEINMENGGEGTKLYSTAGTKFKKLCLQNKLNLLDASVRHLGTDINYVVLQNLYDQMKDKMDFFFDAPVETIEITDGGYRRICMHGSKTGQIFILTRRCSISKRGKMAIRSSVKRKIMHAENVWFLSDEAEANGWKRSARILQSRQNQTVWILVSV